MILAKPTKSLARFIQMVGRVLRKFPGKSKAMLLDHSGTTARLGFPTDDLPLALDDGKPKASGGGKTNERLPTGCPECTYMKPPGVHACPACGFAPERQSKIEIRDGNLVKLERDTQKVSQAEKQATYSGLLWIAAERRRKPGWVAHQYREKFGVWPRGLDDRPSPPTEDLARWVRSRDIRFAKRKGGDHAARS
jgi:DNA repair protein RadD